MMWWDAAKEITRLGSHFPLAVIAANKDYISTTWGQCYRCPSVMLQMETDKVGGLAAKGFYRAGEGDSLVAVWVFDHAPGAGQSVITGPPSPEVSRYHTAAGIRL